MPARDDVPRANKIGPVDITRSGRKREIAMEGMSELFYAAQTEECALDNVLFMYGSRKVSARLKRFESDWICERVHVIYLN